MGLISLTILSLAILTDCDTKQPFTHAKDFSPLQHEGEKTISAGPSAKSSIVVLIQYF